ATIERQLGTRRFLLLFFLTGVGANVIMALLYARSAVFPLSWGCATPVTALFVVFGTMFDRMPSRVLGSLVLEARVLAALVVGFALFADISRGQWVSLAGTAFAVL